jgi:hypothetical protein
MQKITLLFALMFPAIAAAADIARCGTDSFGNVVCLDKDGVLTTLPKGGTGESAASGVSATEPKSGNKESDWVRCGTDPFGNKVCRP